jgi:hypothetical protein
MDVIAVVAAAVERISGLTSWGDDHSDNGSYTTMKRLDLCI